jgi:hypothetical protein
LAIPSPEPTPTPVPTPKPIPALVRKPLPTAVLFNGISLESAVVAEQGLDLASADRLDKESYTLELTLRLRLPRAASTLQDLESCDPSLAPVFTDLPGLLAGARVAPYFEKFYQLKTADVRRKMANLETVLSRHNFYDCETMLELENPATSRKAFLLLADMDVNTDGSDGDRNVTVDASSPFYLPQTSYRWPKQSPRPNPMLAIEEERARKLEEEKSRVGLKPARLAEIESGLSLAKRRIHDLTKWSFLVSSVDPFIVLPGFIMRDHSGPFVPKIGDYAVVLHGGKAYPAILGDSGPSHKAGEASLRLTRELTPSATASARAVSDLSVTYLVFPGSADPEASPPDLARWRERCESLVRELGGFTVELHSWPDIVPPWPTPEPTPAPGPAASTDVTPLASPMPTPEG